MAFLKLFISLLITALLIWALGTDRTIGAPEQLQISETGDTIIIKSTEDFLPPMGKLLSPSHGFWQNAEAKVPAMPSSLQHDALSAPVEVYYDDRMVPHIFAQNAQDVFFAQGYVTASLRLWQMELQTYAAGGRLAEILGVTEKLRTILLEKDREMRRLGLPLAARRSVEAWKKDPEAYKAIDSYAAGVNAYIETLSYDDLPLFYKLRNYRPEPWTPLKTALLLKNMGYTLTNRTDDFRFTGIMKYLGLEQFQQLYEEYFDEQSPIIADSMNYIQPVAVDESNPIQLYLGALGMDSLTQAYSPKGIGSNNWAVSGSKTASGNPILCNDPHLALNLPSIWFEIQLHTPEFNAYGATLPGAPSVISGFNEHIAWGVTNVSHDVQDWYAIKWKDATKTEYWFDSSYRKSTTIIEEYKMRGAASVFDTILLTHFGPVAHQADGQDFVLHWTLHNFSEEPLTFLKLVRAKDYEGYKDAIRHFACPAQNIVFAAKNGDIALWTQGKLPLRKQLQGRFVQQATRSSDLWQGFIPQQDIPHEYNPSKQFVASANQHSIDPKLYPYDYYGYFEEYRGRYLNRKLSEMQNITVEDMMALQYDAYSVKAEDFMPLLAQHLQKGNLSKEALEVWHQLKDWDYKYTKDQVAPVIFETWFDSLQVMVYDEIMALKESDVLIGTKRIRLPDQYNLLKLLKRDTSNAIFDYQKTKDKKEGMADMLTLAFKSMVDSLPRTEDGQIQTWKTRRASVIKHLSRVAALGVDDIDSDGHGSTLNALNTRPGPSWRMVVELGEQTTAYGVYPGGQSGNPGSFYYKNMIEKWAKGEHFPLLFMSDKTAYADKIIIKQTFNN